MTPLTIAILVLQVFSAVFLIAVVLLQSGKRSGLSGSIAGAADTFMARGKARSLDATLSRMTKWVAVLFVIATLALYIFTPSSTT